MDASGEGAEQYPGGIEAAGPEENEDGEFSLDEVDDDTSITSSVHRHTFKNGRRYHKFRHGRYPIPNDEREQNREDMLHAMMLEATNGKYFCAPIVGNPSKILDLGTGTGIWAIESESTKMDKNFIPRLTTAVADMYPAAEVAGIDLSPIQPEWVPPNLIFIVDDMEDSWLCGDNFDFVHLRKICARHEVAREPAQEDLRVSPSAAAAHHGTVLKLTWPATSNPADGSSSKTLTARCTPTITPCHPTGRPLSSAT